jgi:hypothetical protein
VSRLEQDCIDGSELSVLEDGVVPQPDHDPAEELPHLGVRLADKNPRHSHIIGDCRPHLVWNGYEEG